MMNIASFFIGKGRRLSQRDDCDAHFASKNVAKSTQRCVFDDDDEYRFVFRRKRKETVSKR